MTDLFALEYIKICLADFVRFLNPLQIAFITSKLSRLFLVIENFILRYFWHRSHFDLWKMK